MHRDQHSSIQMDGLEDDTIAAADTYHSDQSLTSSGCRPTTCSVHFSSAWAKMPGEPARPAVAAARRSDAVRVAPSNGV